MQSENLLHTAGLSASSSRVCETSLSRVQSRQIGLINQSFNSSLSLLRRSVSKDLSPRLQSDSLVDTSVRPCLPSRVSPGADAFGISEFGGKWRPRQNIMSMSTQADAEATLPVLSSYGQGNVTLEAAPEGFQGGTVSQPKSSDYIQNDGRPYGGKSMLVVVGHRGCGKNKTLPLAETPEARSSIRENTITSFNLAAINGAQFVEFDVQVTKDGVPIIFHDDLIIADDEVSRHIGDVTLEEFLAMGPQRDSNKVSKSLYRKAVDGTVRPWTVDVEDSLCTLSETFAEVQSNVGFNIELKFDNSGETSDMELHRVIDAVLQDVRRYASGRMIYFSSFHPDAVQILRKKQSTYPVFFLTDGGGHIFKDVRRNSIEAALEVCQQGDLQGIVCEVKAVLQNPSIVPLVKDAGLLFFTYGELNNVAEAVCKQQDLGVNAVIVDHVLEMVLVVRQSQQPMSPSSISMDPRTVPVA